MARDPRNGAVTRTLFFILGVVVLGVVITLLIRAEPRPASTVANFDEGLDLNFGLSREAISRTLRLNLCESDELRNSAECTDEESVVPRPEIASAALRRDLISGSGNQFPAAQLGVAASNVGRFGLVVNVNANPTTPSDVEPGVYRGEVVIDRSEGPPILLPVTATLLSRSGPVAWKAGTALAAGALAGTLVKWLEETFSPLAALRRRQRIVRNYLLPHRAVLPIIARTRLDHAQNYIAAYDLDGATEPVRHLHDHQDSLLVFAHAASAVQSQINTQTGILERCPELGFADGAVAAETRALDELQARSWPWEEPATVLQELSTVRRFADRLTSTLGRAADEGIESAPARQLQSWVNRLAKGETIDQMSGDLDKVAEEPTAAQGPASLVGGARTMRSPESVETSGGEGRPKAFDQRSAAPAEATDTRDSRPGLWLLDNASWLTLLFVASIIVFVGFQSEFIDNSSFEGDAADYVRLIGWALAVQVAGGTIIETIGRLRTTRAGSGT